MKSGNEYALLIPVTEHWVFTRLQIILLTIVIDVKNIFYFYDSPCDCSAVQ